MFTPIVDKLCGCGCGNKTGTWSRNDFTRGRIKGEYKKYIAGHKLPPSFKGKKRSFEDRKNKSLAAKKRVSDGTHNFYKGGLSNEWTKIRNSFEYKTWQRNVFKRDGWKCVLCGTKSGWHKDIHKRINIHADHIKPKAIYPDLMFDLTNGRTLCERCHINTPTWGGRTTYAKYIYSR